MFIFTSLHRINCVIHVNKMGKIMAKSIDTSKFVYPVENKNLWMLMMSYKATFEKWVQKITYIKQDEWIYIDGRYYNVPEWYRFINEHHAHYLRIPICIFCEFMNVMLESIGFEKIKVPSFQNLVYYLPSNLYHYSMDTYIEKRDGDFVTMKRPMAKNYNIMENVLIRSALINSIVIELYNKAMNICDLTLTFDRGYNCKMDETVFPYEILQEFISRHKGSDIKYCEDLYIEYLTILEINHYLKQNEDTFDRDIAKKRTSIYKHNIVKEWIELILPPVIGRIILGYFRY